MRLCKAFKRKKIKETTEEKYDISSTSIRRNTIQRTNQQETRATFQMTPIGFKLNFNLIDDNTAAHTIQAFLSFITLHFE